MLYLRSVHNGISPARTIISVQNENKMNGLGTLNLHHTWKEHEAINDVDAVDD